MWKAIRVAYRNRKEIEIAVPAADGIAKISTKAAGYPWTVPMLVHVTIDRGWMTMMKWCETVAEAKEVFEREERNYDDWKKAHLEK